MEKRKLIQGLIGSFIGGVLLFSCSSEDMLGDIDQKEKNELLTISSEQSVCFDIEYDVPEGYKVVFDVYAENPYELTAGKTGKKDLAPIISGMTDDNGRYQVSRVISAGVKEVYVVSKSIRTPMVLHGTIESGSVKPTELDMSTMVSDSSESASRAAFAPYFLGSWNLWGRPDYIDETKSCDITKSELRTISKALPEWRNVNDEYITSDFIYVKKTADVWISLLSAKSLFNNALGYYCYEEGMTKEDIKEIIAFPRTDIAWFNKKGLKSGEYVKLKYLNPETKQFEDKFPAGSRIGWVLHRSGFRCMTSQVNNGTYQFYSNSAWNPEKSKKEHTAIFSTSEGHVILGFEDVYNENFLADNDCNDVIFHVTSCPEDAISTEVEIPDVSTDVVEEEVDVVQQLSMIIDVPVVDELANDLCVASKSTMEVEDGYVVGIKDVLYIATSEAMNNLVTQTYTMSEMERKVVVRTTVKFARAAEEEGKEKKGRTVVRTTVKNTTWEVEEAANSRALMYYSGDIADLILANVEKYREQLAAGKCIRLEINMQFEGVDYGEFIENITVPPFSPFIEHVGE